MLLWPLPNETIANRSIANLDELESVTSYRCRVTGARDFIRGLTNFYWWAAAVAAATEATANFETGV